MAFLCIYCKRIRGVLWNEPLPMDVAQKALVIEKWEPKVLPSGQEAVLPAKTQTITIDRDRNVIGAPFLFRLRLSWFAIPCPENATSLFPNKT